MQRPASSFPKPMLTINGHSHGRFCDGVARRDFLRIGGLALGGLSLPQILRAESASGVKKSHKAVIMIFLPGGPSHQDIFDLKMDAPSEVRGEFKPIGTNVAGIQITEHLPKLAKMMDRCTLIRSMSNCDERHDAFQCLTGRDFKNQPQGGWPAFGSVVAKVQGATDSSVPPFVGLAPKMGHMEWARTGEPGFLGIKHAPFEPNKGSGNDDMTLNGVTLDRLADRRSLLTSFDSFRRDMDRSGAMDGMDAFNQQAFGVLTSSKLLDALDLLCQLGIHLAVVAAQLCYHLPRGILISDLGVACFKKIDECAELFCFHDQLFIYDMGP
jgi:hypothetical protein